MVQLSFTFVDGVICGIFMFLFLNPTPFFQEYLWHIILVVLTVRFFVDLYLTGKKEQQSTEFFKKKIPQPQANNEKTQ